MTEVNSQPMTEVNVVTPLARFTKDEKTLLYELFKENEDMIDIKHRKNCSKKLISVRECWEKIAEDYNRNPVITTKRNVKQIQKFWLNARLRKHYPGGWANSSGSDTNANISDIITIKTPQKIKQQRLHPPPLTQHIQNHPQLKIQPVERIQHIKFENVDNDMDGEIEMIEEDDLQQVEISTSSNDVGSMDVSQPMSHHQPYNIDHISAEKLTLNDLLEFKNSRSVRDDIVLQIKSDSLGTATAIQQQPQKDISGMPTYTTSYRIANSSTTGGIPTFVSTEHHPTYQTIQQSFQSQPQHQHKPTVMLTTQQSPTNCCQHQQQQQTPPSRSAAIETLDEKIEFYKLKEAELRYKEEQLKWEQSKINLQRAREELKHVKEYHAYQIEEMKLKLKILAEEENRLRMK